MHTHKYSHNPRTPIATTHFLWNVIPFTVKLQTFWRHLNFTFICTFIKAFLEQDKSKICILLEITTCYHVH